MQDICSEVLSSLHCLSEKLSSAGNAGSAELHRLNEMIDRLSEQLPSLRSYIAERQQKLQVQEQRSASPSAFLSDCLARQKKLSEALTLNDRFRFSSELFNGDMHRLMECVEQMEQTGSREEAENCLRKYAEVQSGEAFREFMEILTVHFV